MAESHNNQELFSNYYLNERLPKLSIWQEAEGVEKAYQDISRRYGDKKAILSSTKETQTEEEWIKPIFSHILNLYYIPGPSAPIFRTSKEPDYAFFLTEKIKNKAYNEQGKEELFDQAIAVGDAKRWDKDLNQIRPNKQIDNYLRITDTKWGILTNGRLWRIYNIDSSYKLDVFYEVDLIQLIGQGDLEAFKYFYLFFRRQAFVKDGFLEEVYEESEDYSEAVSSDLRESVYGALQQICQGFLDGNQDLTPKDVEEIYQNALILLYRIVFILYAESDEDKELLPMKNPDYKRSHSLRSLKEKAVKQINNGQAILPTSHDCWIKLKDLFHFIDRGEERLGIYEYNGGLFDRDQHGFLEKYQIGDEYLADAIYLLTYSEAEDGFIDYRDLDVRELGSIYEGLLEHKLVIKEDKIDWEIDKSERKKTGSYYTPDYIVKYIVRNTIGPLVDEIEETFQDEVKELDKRIKKSRGYNRQAYQRQLEEKKEKLRDRMLELVVLDPAMGSGHFLVEATEFLATSIADLEERFAESEKEAVASENDAVGELKRQIVERSIYGVDKNPLATELAKLSLWLHTVAKGEPLSFLDHHLRTGDSLIGIDIEEMKQLPSQRKDMAGLFESRMIQDLSNAIGHLIMIEEFTSQSREDIQTKKKEWRDVKAWIDKYRQAANLHLSTYFGNEVSEDQYFKVLEAAANNNIESVEDEPYFKQAQKIAEDKHFFHWELEFPNVFRNKRGKQKETAGFDVVIGNPPYRTVALGKGQEKPGELELEYLRRRHPDASEYKSNTFTMFMDKGMLIARNEGLFSMIIPRTFLTNHYFQKIREKFLTRITFKRIVNIKAKVFYEAEIGGTIIPVIRKRSPQATHKVEIFHLHDLGCKFVDEVVQSHFLKITDSKILLEPSNLNLIRKLQEKGAKLVEDATFYQGIITGNNDKFLTNNPTDKKHKKVIRGRDITRYCINWGGDYVYFDEKELWSNTESKMFKTKPKILLRQTGDKIIAGIDYEGRYSLDSTILVILASQYHKYTAALLNSKLLNWYYQQMVPEKGRTFSQIKIVNLKKLPIKPVDFTLSVAEREKLAEKFRNRYNSLISGKEPAEVVNNFVRMIFNRSSDDQDAVYDMLVYLAAQIEKAKKQRLSLNTGLLDYLRPHAKRECLKEIVGYQPPKGLADSMLSKSQNSYPGLQIHSVSSTKKSDRFILYITARYKPENPDEYDTDRWGYTETDPIPAMEFVDLSEDQEALIKEFVPVAVEKAGGFANFRKKATKTISLIDRLEKLTLPKLEDVKDGLQRFLEVKSKAEELDEKIERTDELIDQIVYRLYGLTEEEIQVVEKAV